MYNNIQNAALYRMIQFRIENSMSIVKIRTHHRVECSAQTEQKWTNYDTHNFLHIYFAHLFFRD